MSDTPLRHAIARAIARTNADLPHQHVGPTPTPRNPHAITPSPYRPHVLASERLRAWSSPYGLRFRRQMSSNTSPEATTRLTEVMLTSLELPSRRNYGAGLLRFTQFCDLQHVSEEERMPASDALIAAFVAKWSGSVSRSTIDTWLAGLAFWHSLNGAPWLSSRLVKITCKGASKLQPASKRKRSPVTVEHLACLFNHLDLANSFDAAVFAVATIAFWSCRR